MNKFILIKDYEDEKIIKYINLNNVDMIIPETDYACDNKYEVTIYFNGSNMPLCGFISYETAEEFFEHFQFEGEVIND